VAVEVVLFVNGPAGDAKGLLAHGLHDPEQRMKTDEDGWMKAGLNSQALCDKVNTGT
jgi:hypothetical protein